MKKSNIIIAICIVFVCIIGWFTVGSQLMKNSNLYADYVTQADELIEKGLYQRAIVNYNLALDEKETEEIYIKMNTAYELRYKEAPDETIDDYMDFLKIAINAYPGNQTLVDSFVNIYYIESKYDDIYNCLVNAIDNGYDTEEVRTELRQTQYAFKLRKSEFSNLKQSVEGFYSIGCNNGWNVYCIEDGYLLSKEYEYVSCANKDGIVIVTGEDSRIVDTTGMVYGIFNGKVTDASLFSNELIAACVDGNYSYYDDLADKQFGEYEIAGSFQDGKAAVKKDGKWMLIDTKGNVISDTYDEIILDYIGNYLNNGLMLAKKNGLYGLYDEKLKLHCEINFDNVDIVTEDGIIAVSKDSKWGFVDSEGKVILEPTYEEARSFLNGIAAVKENGKWGFIDINGNVVIDFQFSDVGYLASNAICPVRIDMPEEKIDSDSIEEPEIVESMEIWKMLELEIGIKEN